MKMIIHTLEPNSSGNYASRADNNVLKMTLAAMLNIDIWILMNVGLCLKRIITILKPILEALLIMSLGAGLLLAYSLMYMPDNEAYFNHKLTNKKAEIIAITDTSNYDKSFVERELIRLRNKALNLEMSLTKINLKLHSICKHKNTIDESLPDFASEAAGGAVISTPDTESFYEPNQIQSTIFGIPIWRPNYYTPRKVIQPWTQAGECWAFHGSNGNIEIELAHLALLNRVTLEHIPVSASLTGSVDSAPRELRVLGRFRNKYLLLGTYVYNVNGPISQIFDIKNDEMRKVPFKIIMLQILSNWGNPAYTCIYRFRVHGKIYEYYSD